MCRTITLNNGIEMPRAGFGVYQIAPDETKKAVLAALEAGVRLIDTAQAYGNEKAVGEAIAASGIERSEIFITDKVWISNAGDVPAQKSIDASLAALGVDYIDLMLIHQPFGDYYGTWRALEKALSSGKVRAIGLSNFTAGRFIDLAEHADVKPAVVQLETHVYCQQHKMRDIISAWGTRLMAWAPLAEGQNGFFDDPRIKRIAERHGKSVAQIALKYLVDLDTIVIPKSVRPERIKENADIDDIVLEADEIKELRALDGGKPLLADFENPDLVRFLLNYSKTHNL